MKLSLFRLFMSVYLLTVSQPFLFSNSDTNAKISYLLELNDEGIIYSSKFPIDTVYNWSSEILSEPDVTDDENLYFKMRRIQVNALAAKRDIVLAIDKGNEMFLEAMERENGIGIALASETIGDVYTLAGMFREGVQFFQEAVDKLQNYPDTDPIQRKIYFKLVMLELHLKNIEKATMYVKLADNLQPPSTNDNLLINTNMYHAFYHLGCQNLDSAKIYIDQIESMRDRMDTLVHGIRFYQLYAKYYEAHQENEKALGYYLKIFSLGDKLHEHDRYILYSALAALYLKMNRPEEACRCYKVLKEIKDKSSAESYIRQINTFRTIYQVDQLQLENKSQQNRILFYCILISALLVGFVSLLSILLRINSRRLINSKQKLKKEKEKAEESIRTKSLFLSNMSHEIRTPLNALVGFSSLLSVDAIDEETQQQCFDQIHTNSSLLLKLINDVIDMSSFNIGDMEFHIERCNANVLCEGIVETVNNIKQTKARILFETDFDTLPIETDVNRLQQVLINLLVNATKFTKDGTITLSLKLSENQLVHFAVTDTGCGIPLEKQARIFQRFEKLNENEQGAGLGLSICQLIVERLGGTIWVDSDYTEGARFIFSHPVKQAVNA